MVIDVPNRSLAKRWGNHESLLEGGWVGVLVAFLSQLRQPHSVWRPHVCGGNVRIATHGLQVERGSTVSKLYDTSEAHGNYRQTGAALCQGS